MAFNITPKSKSTSNANQDWKADGFLNFSLPTRNGESRKLGSISLKLSNEAQAELTQWLLDDPENAQLLSQRLIIKFNSAAPAEGTEFDLASLKVPVSQAA